MNLKQCFHTYLQTYGSYLTLLPPVRGGEQAQLRQARLQALRWLKKKKTISSFEQPIHLMLSAASCTPGTVQYVRVCPRFPLPDSFPPGRLSWDGDWQKKKGKKEKKRGGRGGGDRGGGGASLNNQRCLDQQNDLPPLPPINASMTVRRAALRCKR